MVVQLESWQDFNSKRFSFELKLVTFPVTIRDFVAFSYFYSILLSAQWFQAHNGQKSEAPKAKLEWVTLYLRPMLSNDRLC